MYFKEWMDYMLGQKAEQAKDAKERLRRNGEERIGGLQIGGSHRKCLKCRVTFHVCFWNRSVKGNLCTWAVRI